MATGKGKTAAKKKKLKISPKTRDKAAAGRMSAKKAEQKAKKIQPARTGKTPKKISQSRRTKPPKAVAGAGKSTKTKWKKTIEGELLRKRSDIVREAKAEIARLVSGDARQIVETALDEGDWSVIDLSEGVNLKRLETHRNILLSIDEALRKMREGTYGICDECGEGINAERLKVMPFAILCRDCQEKKEKFEKIEREEFI